MKPEEISGVPDIKLFIYIPSYNRPKALRQQLLSLSPQTARNHNQARVLVSDNATPNNEYDSLVKEFKTDNISFRRNPGNIGGNANIALGFIFANSNEFLWILSDNDIVIPDAIDYLLMRLGNNLDFIYFANNLIKEQEILFDWKGGWEGPLNGLGLISAGIYNMKTVSPCISDAFFFHNSSFPHLAVALSAAKYHSCVRFKLLPRDRVLSKSVEFEDPGNYSLSSVGMPLLSTLMPPDKAEEFCWGWLGRRGLNMYENRSQQRAVFLQSTGVLKSYGIKFQLLLFFYGLVVHPFSLAKKIRKIILKAVASK